MVLWRVRGYYIDVKGSAVSSRASNHESSPRCPVLLFAGWHMRLAKHTSSDKTTPLSKPLNRNERATPNEKQRQSFRNLSSNTGTIAQDMLLCNSGYLRFSAWYPRTQWHTSVRVSPKVANQPWIRILPTVHDLYIYFKTSITKYSTHFSLDFFACSTITFLQSISSSDWRQRSS